MNRTGWGGLDEINLGPKGCSSKGRKLLGIITETTSSRGKHRPATLLCQESHQRKCLESLPLRNDTEGWILDRLGLLRVTFSGGAERQLVTCQMALARLAGSLTPRGGDWEGFLGLLVQTTRTPLDDR